MTTTRVVVAGGGFAGIRLARELAARNDVAVTLVSDRDTFAYYPQLYHAATGGVRSEAAIPLAELLEGTSVDIVIDPAMSFDPATKILITKGKQRLPYDYLALALGSVTNYFGIKGLPEYSYGIKTIEDAEEFKYHLHEQLINKHTMEAQYVVVGAGPTGVELSAALSGYLQRIAAHHGVKKPNYRIDLVEASPRVLPRSSEKISAKVHRRLEQLGVNVMTGVTVKGETASALKLQGASIATQTVVWTSGVANNPFFTDNAIHFRLAKGNHVEVDEYLQSNGVYVLGDNAAVQYAGLAETAVRHAGFAAADILRQVDGQSRTAYQPKRPSPVTPVGHRWAVAELGFMTLFGYPGWLVRRVADLIAYRDIERLPAALNTWLKEPLRQDNCPVCKNA